MNCCNEFSRSTLLRRAVAEAGNGLPAIEPGMPLPPVPASTVARSSRARVGAALTVYGASALGPKLSTTASRGPRRRAGAGRRVLVSIFAPGGWDALSLLYPTGDPRYRKLRNSARAEARRRACLPIRLPPPLASVAAAARAAARARAAHGLPGDRLRASRPVAFHLAALLGSRRARSAVRHGLARAPARRDRRRGERDAGPVARRCAAALARDGARARGDALEPGRLRLRLAQRLGRARRAAQRRDRLARRPRQPTRIRYSRRPAAR